MDDYEAAATYVARHCVPAKALAAQAGLDEARLAALAEAAVVPEPTYRVGGASVISAIGRLGREEPGAAAWYGVSVLGWLRRAALLAETVPKAGLAQAMRSWLAKDLRAALDRTAADAQAFGWAGLFSGGVCDPASARAWVDAEWDGWIAGGWAVCLRRFDGWSLAVKEIERARIAALTDHGRRAALARGERLSLLDAMARLDAVLLPFAPHERPRGTPGLFLDEPARRYGLPWPGCRGTTGSSIDDAVSPVR